VTTIAVFGISGVGKSRMCAILAARLGLVHAQASDLLKLAKREEAGEAVSSEELRKGPVLDNQTMLVSSFSNFAAEESRNILFDGHSLIDIGDTLIEIPVEVIEAIGPGAVLFLWEEPQTIADRRAADSGRRRPFRSADELARHQARAEELAGLYAANLRIPFFRVRSGDEEECCATVTQVLARA
jgi:adenylate kinase